MPTAKEGAAQSVNVTPAMTSRLFLLLLGVLCVLLSSGQPGTAQSVGGEGLPQRPLQASARADVGMLPESLLAKKRVRVEAARDRLPLYDTPGRGTPKGRGHLEGQSHKLWQEHHCSDVCEKQD